MIDADIYLFDWDNTLVDTWPTIHAALNMTMLEMGQEEWPLEKTKTNVKRSMREAFPEMFGDEWERAGEIYQCSYKSMHLDNLLALPQAEKLLIALRAKGKKIGAVSNKRGPTLREEIAHIGWGDYFDAIVGAGDAEYDKPHTAPAELALSHMGLSMQDKICFVGDTIVDLECSNQAKFVTILFGDVQTDDNSNYLGHAFAHHVRDHNALMALV